MGQLFTPDALAALITLTALEIVLGIDNIIFISIITGKLPAHLQQRARITGLGLAMFMRIALLFSLTWIMRLTSPVFEVLGNAISGRDIVLILGGLFLLGKSTLEIHDSLEGEEGSREVGGSRTMANALAQIVLLDIVFSLDSVITAIGMSDMLLIMVLAVVIAVIFMMLASGRISSFVEEHPTIKVLALSFLLLVGIALVADGFDLHVPRGYIYFAMAFSVFVEMMNMKIRKRAAEPVHLRKAFSEDAGPKN